MTNTFLIYSRWMLWVNIFDILKHFGKSYVLGNKTVCSSQVFKLNKIYTP